MLSYLMQVWRKVLKKNEMLRKVHGSYLILYYPILSYLISYPILPYLILYDVVEKDKEGGDDIVNCIDCGKSGPDSEAILTRDWPGPYCFECYAEDCGCSNFASCE